jgi:hypothetical protein
VSTERARAGGSSGAGRSTGGGTDTAASGSGSGNGKSREFWLLEALMPHMYDMETEHGSRVRIATLQCIKLSRWVATSPKKLFATVGSVLIR